MEPQIGDTVICRIARTQLAVVLTALHRGGYGHLTKVLDPSRTPVAGQLIRLGIEPPVEFDVAEPHVAVVISAPARTGVVEAIIARSCGCRCWTVSRTVTPNSVFLASMGTKSPPRKRAGNEAFSTD